MWTKAIKQIYSKAYEFFFNQKANTSLLSIEYDSYLNRILRIRTANFDIDVATHQYVLFGIWVKY